MPDFSIGVDMGGTNLRIAAVSTEGQLLEKITLGVKVALGRDYVIGEMCDAINRLTAQYAAGGRFVGAGIGVPGIIDMRTGMMRKSANLPGWSEYPVRDDIERRLGARVFLDNDAKMAAFGEKWLGAGREVDNMAMITLGTGIGGAIILNGKIFYGMNGMAGEFGHVTIEPNGVPCGCGNHGCSERYASATALVRMAREAIDSGKAPGLAKAAISNPDFSARSIYDWPCGRSRRSTHLSALRQRLRESACQLDQCAEPRNVCHRRRRDQRVGRLRSHACSPNCANDLWSTPRLPPMNPSGKRRALRPRSRTTASARRSSRALCWAAMQDCLAQREFRYLRKR